jgi:hypothetical protein
METDKRVKLTPEQKAEILAIPLKEGHFKGYTQIAKKYGVHKRTIEFLFNPEKLEMNRKLATARRKNKKD